MARGSGGGAPSIEFILSVVDKQFKSALKEAEEAIGQLPLKTAAWNLALNAGQKAVQMLGETLKESFKEFTDFELALGKMEGVLKATGYSAGFTSTEMEKLAESFQATTMFDDTSMLNAMSLLSTFPNITGKVFKEATHAIADLSAGGFGSLESMAKTLGKALDSPTEGLTALTRAGIRMSESSKGMIAHFVEINDIAAAQNIILAAVKDRVDELAESQGEKTAGKIDRLNNAYGELKKGLGSLIADALMPFIDVLEQRLPKAMDDTTEKVTTWGDVLKISGKQWWDSIANADPMHNMKETVADMFKQQDEKEKVKQAELKRQRDTLYENAGEAAKKVNDAEDKRLEGVKKWRDAMEKSADAVRKSVQTPFDKALEKAQEIQKLARGGFIDTATLRGAMADIREDLLKPDRDAIEKAMDKERTAREKVGDIDEQITELTKDKGFTASIESMTGMWERIQTAAGSRPEEDKQLQKLEQQRAEAMQRWNEEKRLMEETNELLRKREQAAVGIFG
jgi:hypothetical protein